MEKRSNHRQKHSRFIYAVWKLDLDDETGNTDQPAPELENLLQELYAQHPKKLVKKLVRFAVEDTDVTDTNSGTNTGNGLNDTTE